MDAFDLLFHHHHGQNQMAAFDILPLILKCIQHILNIIEPVKEKVYTLPIQQF